MSRKNKPMKMVVVLSGGLDSTTLLYETLNSGYTVTSVVSFNYGQKHSKELEYAAATAKKQDLVHHIIDLSGSGLIEAMTKPDNALIGDADVPEGHYAEDSMKSTVVPNRNMIMVSMALAIAVAEGAQAVALGVHGGDHFVYPDCRPGFVLSAALAGYLGNEGMSKLWRSPIWAPFIHKSKNDIAFRALELGVPLEETWSCYKGGEIHCGKCGTCVERLEAINDALQRVRNLQARGEWKSMILHKDLTEYEDSVSWMWEKETK